MKILLLEDNQTLNDTIRLTLEKKGYKVSAFINGCNALKNITYGFSCFILDINVAGIDGIKILQKIRSLYKEVPIIIISSSIELEIIEQSYTFGCSEFIKKPFFIYELEIKIQKLCKISKENIYFNENSYFNFEKNELMIDEKISSLTQKESLILNLFLHNQNKIITYENIQDYVYKGEYCSYDAIRTLVKRLRKKLYAQSIKTLSSKGYMFIS